MTSPSPSPAPALVDPLEDDDLLSEILLRLPAQPSSLPRASLVSPRWRRLVSGPAFLRRFRARHRFRKPPLLGCFVEKYGSQPCFVPTLQPPNCVPDGRFSLRLDDIKHRIILDCRHGLVLFLYSLRQQIQVVVWDPVTGDQHWLGFPPGLQGSQSALHGAVLRDAGDARFQVFLVGAMEKHVACVYSSATCAWANLVTALLRPPSTNSFAVTVPSVLVGHCLYWCIVGDPSNILELDFGSRRLAVVPVPMDTSPAIQNTPSNRFWVMPAEGGGLGFIYLSALTVQLWKRETNSDGVSAWLVAKTVELDKLLSLDPQGEMPPLCIQGIAEENKVLFLWVATDLFMVDLESFQFKKLGPMSADHSYLPFESVYTAATGIGGGQDGAGLLHNA